MHDLGPTLPAHLYRDEATYGAEREAIFGRDWWVVGLDGEIEAGTAIARTIAGFPVLVLRTPSGELRGFHNVCRHRAGPLVHDDAVEACPTALRCKYHGWAYGLDGELLSTPDFGGSLDRSGWPLHRVRVACHRGLVFVSLDLDGQEALADFLGPFADVLPDLSGYRVVRRTAHRLRCNWKTYVENYLEGYHIPYVHPGLRRSIVMREYAVRRCGPAVTHHVPMRQEDSAFSGFWAWLWPNVAVNVYEGACSLERIVPTGARTMSIAYTYAHAPDADEAQAIAGEAGSAEVTVEDIAICEAVQRNLEAGIYTEGRLSPRHEDGIAMFRDRVRVALGLERG